MVLLRKKKKKKYEANFIAGVRKKSKIKVLFKRLVGKDKKRKPVKH